MEKFMEKQQTIAKRVSLNGIALHTGVRATLTLNPAEENTGIIFRRIDLPGKPEVKALASNVVDARRGTTIGNEKCAVYTIEHIMSALHVFGIDNCIVDMDGTEPPILDGSANGFFNLVKEAGIVQQAAEALYYEVKTPFYVRHEDTHIGIFPGDKLHIACTASFIGCPIDPQYFSLDVTPETYEKEIAGARTFVNFSDLRQLIGMGLCKGGSLDAAAIIHNGAIICKEELRHQDEIVRHKILDLIGDLYLCGRRVKADVIAIKPGHFFNVKLAGMMQQSLKDQN